MAVTGMGCVSALGRGTAAFWDSCRAGRTGIGPITLAPEGEFRFSSVAEANCFDPESHFAPKELMSLDRFAQMAVVAAREAVGQAGWKLSAAEKERAAIVTGSCYGGKPSEDDGYRSLYRDGQTRLHPMTIPRLMANAGASALSLELGWQGPAWTVSTACASASHAIGQAFELIRGGKTEVALAGGSEAPLTYGSLRAWEALRVVSPDTCRPFSAERSGMILGEGAAMLALENWEHAQARGAVILAELVGFAMGADAHHLTQPSAAGAARAMRLALADANLEPGRAGVINAHGTGTAANDIAEAEAISDVFGPPEIGPFVTATKSLHGHALGASGALEAVAAVLGLRDQAIPGTANFLAPDPACPVRLATEWQHCAHEAAVSNSFAFGGLNAVLVFLRAG